MAINVVLENPQLTVLGPPAQVELNINSGEKGPRGSYIYSGSGNPNNNNLLTDKILGDLFIRTDTGLDYGAVYQYSVVPGGAEWVKILDINVDTTDIAFFISTASAFATSASISAINANNYQISASGFALSSSSLYISTLVALQSTISSASNALVSEQNSLSYYLSSSSFFVSSETNALNSFNSAVSASNNALNSFNSATSASISAACALYLTSLNNSYAASSQFWASVAEQFVSSGVASAAYWAGVSEQFSIDAAASAAYWVNIAEQNALSASNLYVTRDNEINTTIDFRSASVMLTSSSVSGLNFGIDDVTAIAYASSASANANTRALGYAISASANADTRALVYANSASANADTRALDYANSASANADTRALDYANSASANADTRALSYAVSASANANVVANAALALKANIDSPTFTGTVTLNANPTQALQAATKQYVDSVSLNTQTASYVLVLSDAGKTIEMNVNTENSVTIPLNSSQAFPIETVISVVQYGSGQTTLVATSGVTIRSKEGNLKLTGQYSGATLYKKGTDEWVAIGDLTA